MGKKKNFFEDEDRSNNDTTEFERLFSGGAGSSKKLKSGDSFRGEILSIGKEESFVSTGTPIDGMVLTVELLDSKKQLKYKVGDFLDVKVIKVRDDQIILKPSDSKSGSADIDSLEDAFDMELAVEGRVTEVVKGGYRVVVMGKTAFCPISQIDMHVKEPVDYLEKKFEFMITKFEESGRNIVVSRRKILDAKKFENEGEFIQKFKSGDMLKGTITRLEKFGAFVELEAGVQALIPISELAWGRVQSPAEVVNIGQEVTVMILKIEEAERLRVSVSLKQAGGEGDPWLKVPKTYPIGLITEGPIERKEPYGIFVKLGPGITGLLPKSKWADSVDHQNYEHKKKGDTVAVQVDQINVEEHKISLTVPSEKVDLSWKDHAPSSKGSMGTFGDLLKQGLAKSPSSTGLNSPAKKQRI